MAEDVGGLIEEALFELLAHPSIALFLTPVVTIACLTNDWMISLTAIAVLFITCWACGIR